MTELIFGQHESTVVNLHPGTFHFLLNLSKASHQCFDIDQDNFIIKVKALEKYLEAQRVWEGDVTDRVIDKLKKFIRNRTCSTQ